MTKKTITRKKKLSSRKPRKIRSTPVDAAVPTDEKQLFKKMKLGNEAARNQLLKNYSSWATNIARKYHSLFPNIEVSELEAEGNRGILEALDKYDPSKNTKFSTYSWFWITKNIQEYVTSSMNLIGVPAKIMSDLRTLIGAMNDKIKKGDDASVKDIAKKLGMDEGDAMEMLADKKNVSSPLSLDMYMDEEDRQEKFGDMVEDKKLGSIRQILEGVDDKKFIGRLLEGLSPIEKKVISLRFGFSGGKSLTLVEISRLVKIPPSKVKDIEAIVLIKLKRMVGGMSEAN